MIRAIFFDLDGTLIHMDEDLFEHIYFKTLCEFLVPYGYDAATVKGAIFKGCGAMMMNESGLTNEEVFWNTFNKVIGRDCTGDKPIFEQYYKTDFHKIKESCGKFEESRAIIDYCKENFDVLVLSTNPLFPAIATNTRMGYSDLVPSDFNFVTTYENTGFCKPNPKYFMYLMDKFNLKPEEVLVVGNHIYEDCECASMCGIKAILLKGDIIYDQRATKTFDEIDRSELIDYLKKIKNS